MDSLKLFIWGYQPHFQLSAKTYADQLFGALDADLSPNVFLVGILWRKHLDRHPVCIEADGSGYNLIPFSDVVEKSGSSGVIDKHRLNFDGLSEVQVDRQNGIELRTLREAVQRVVRRLDRYREVVTFCSLPVELEIEGFLVCAALQLRKDAFKAHYSLKSERIDDDRRLTPSSLLDAIVSEYLSDCSDGLERPNPGEEPATLGRSVDEVILSAGRSLMTTAAGAGDPSGSDSLFQACNAISSMGDDVPASIGQLLISKPEHPNVDMIVQFDRPIRLNDYQTVRRLLEIFSGGPSLVTDSIFVHGIGRLSGSYDRSREDLFIVKFGANGRWDLIHAEHHLMDVANGIPALPRPSIDEPKFRSSVRRIFSSIDRDRIDTFWKFILSCVDQKYGTTVIVSSCAKEMADRLSDRRLNIKPAMFTPEMAPVAAAVGGAVLVGTDGVCYAIGVTPNGPGTAPGEGRLDSAARYLEGSCGECLAIVVSDDGRVDVEPDLKPQIKISWITEMVAQLHGVYDSSTFDHAAYDRAMTWLSRNRFYLSPTQCSEINRLITKIRARFEVLDPLWMLHKEFVPDATMNPSYLLS